ncbi:DUF2971 domain-containing protein [Aeromonas salmonicida]|uniref:DUF2971 domain-containing protein n=1 Tax=Aeromonas salmonicida TaxID=645 RepID=UPI002796ADC8|nr:DUF2971 domain-containing protein [Aeromonas salmonicida]MDQ1882921.1 DUF2971 domain-containing protein [Aeromonas salmonicida]MDR7018879.1 hypothetical protein [Aeromonas salmonicida]
MIGTNSIYKFFPYNPHDLDAIANNYLWFSNYKDFNDPFEDVFIENVLNVDTDIYSETKAIAFYKMLHKKQLLQYKIEEALLQLKLTNKLETHYINTISSTLTAAKSELSNLVKNSRITCFAKDNLEKKEFALKNRLMWSHYANGLRGFCIEYDTLALIEGISKEIGRKVGYSTIQYGKLKKYGAEELLFNTLKNIQEDNNSLGIGTLTILKSSEWEYEREFRIFVQEQSLVPIPTEAIKSITIGSKIEKLKLNTLLSIIRGNPRINCKINWAYIDINTFEIELDEFYGS